MYYQNSMRTRELANARTRIEISYQKKILLPRAWFQTQENTLWEANDSIAQIIYAAILNSFNANSESFENRTATFCT